MDDELADAIGFATAQGLACSEIIPRLLKLLIDKRVLTAGEVAHVLGESIAHLNGTQTTMLQRGASGVVQSVMDRVPSL